MIKRHTKEWIAIAVLILAAGFMNVTETFLSGEGIYLRTFTEMIKGVYVWLIAPIGTASLLFAIVFQETKEDKKLLHKLSSFLFGISVFGILAIDMLILLFYNLSGEMETEIRKEDGILEVEHYPLDGMYTTYEKSFLFLFRAPYQGYDKEEFIQKIKTRFGDDAKIVGEKDSLYTVLATIDSPVEGEITFLVKNDYPLTNNYEQEIFRFLGDTFFLEKNRYVTWEETEQNDYGIGNRYIPILDLSGRYGSEAERFCSNVSDFMEYCLKNETLADNKEILSILYVMVDGEKVRIGSFRNYLEEFDKGEFYNYLYREIERISMNSYKKSLQENIRETNTEKTGTEVTEELTSYLLSIEPACTTTNINGLEYRLVETDRACGSSYYSLVATNDNGKTAALVNPDPFLGSGGGAMWISFIDEKIGFSCLSYSGGTYGSLYRTQDGGESFHQIEYPSAKAKLPDGTLYNPFVMPEQIWKENEKLVMIVGQGPDGDYKGGNEKCFGRYESKDDGITWSYVGETENKNNQ